MPRDLRRERRERKGVNGAEKSEGVRATGQEFRMEGLSAPTLQVVGRVISLHPSSPQQSFDRHSKEGGLKYLQALCLLDVHALVLASTEHRRAPALQPPWLGVRGRVLHVLLSGDGHQ